MSKNNMKNILSTVGLLLVVGGLFAWPILNDETRSLVKTWNDAGVGCLSGHSAIAGGGQHIHQQIMITVDGAPETLVGDIGIARSCMAETHVHSGENNRLHVESVVAGKKFTLGQFFVVYGKPFIRDGYKLEVTSNGVLVDDPANLVLEDHQVIQVKYTKES